MMNVLELSPQMVWGPWTLVIFLGVGIFFTLKCHFSKLGDFILVEPDRRTAHIRKAVRKGG